MRVYLLRHGIAEAEGYADDGHRPLTEVGRQAFRASAALWSQQGPAPTRWIASPLVRAVQTAEIGLAAFGSAGPLATSIELTPDARVSAAAQLVDDHFGETLALVGHQPLMGALAAFLLGLRSVPAQVQPGAILALDLPDGPGDPGPRLAWHLRPGPPPQILVPPQPAS